MEKEISELLDQMEMDEIDALLEKEMNVKMDRKTLKRLQGGLLHKAGFKNRSKIGIQHKLIAVAATLVILAGVGYAIGFGNVAMALSKVFSFIPGVAVVENSSVPQDFADIKYSISKPTIAENEKTKIDVKGTATEKTITLTLKVSQQYNSKTMDSHIEMTKLTQSSFFLSSAQKTYTGSFKPRCGECGRSEEGPMMIHVGSVQFNLPVEEINSHTLYTLYIPLYNMNISFRLEDVVGAQSLSEIGATESHNGISITAVSAIVDGILVVDLYPINKSGYDINEFTDIRGTTDSDNVLYLETDKGIKNYIPYTEMDRFDFEPYSRFRFDVSDGAQNYVLKIPYVSVSSNEVQSVTVPLPKRGGSIQPNQSLSFQDSIVTITDIHSSIIDNGKTDECEFSIKSTNKDPNKVFVQADWEFLTWHKEYDHTPVNSGEYPLKSIFYNVTNVKGNSVKIYFSRPIYKLMGEYSLKLNPQK